MSQQINLRQVQAFKAVIENGTVSRAAEILHISQPATSKLISHLEIDTGLKLFDRHKGRLIPTESGKRLYNEVDRIFASLRQVDNAVGAIRRHEQGRISVGVLPALAGPFIRRVTTNFLKDHGNVFCSIQAQVSQSIVNSVIERKVDVGLVEGGFKNPYVHLEPLLEQPIVCVMPPDHPLTAKTIIRPQDLDKIPFVSFPLDNGKISWFTDLCEHHQVKPQIVLAANFLQTVCEFVAAGIGISLVHPLMASSFRCRLAVRRFEPRIVSSVALCHCTDGRNTELTNIFAQQIRDTAKEVTCEVLKGL